MIVLQNDLSFLTDDQLKEKFYLTREWMKDALGESRNYAAGIYARRHAEIRDEIKFRNTAWPFMEV